MTLAWWRDVQGMSEDAGNGKEGEDIDYDDQDLYEYNVCPYVCVLSGSDAEQPAICRQINPGCA